MLVGSLKYIISCPLIVAHRLNIILTRLKLAVLTGYSSYAVKGGAFVVSVDVLAPLAAIGITPPTHRSLLLCALCLK